MIHPLNYPVSPSPTYVFSGQSIILWASFHLLGAEDIQRQHNKPLLFVFHGFFSRAYLSGTGSWNLWTHFNLTTSLRGLPHWLSCKDSENPNSKYSQCYGLNCVASKSECYGNPLGVQWLDSALELLWPGFHSWSRAQSKKKKKKNNNKKTAPSLKTNK